MSQSETPREAPPLNLATRLSYGVGQLSDGVKQASFSTFLFFYYNQVLGLSGSLAGMAALLAMPLQSAYNTAERAAAIIIKEVLNNKRRILVGTDAKIMSLLTRLFPGSYEKIMQQEKGIVKSRKERAT